MAERAKLNSAYIPHTRVPYVDELPSMTRQEFADECDINVLMAKYDKVGGFPPPLPGREPAYFDAADVPTDFREVMDMLNEAEDAFMRLPAVTRREFDNDPRQFVEFAMNSENLPKMREWGLAAPEKVPDPPMRVEVVNPAPAVPGAGNAPE